MTLAGFFSSAVGAVTLAEPVTAGCTDLRTESVESVDSAAHTVLVGSGRTLDYRKLPIATGGENRRLRVPAAELPGIHYLRTAADSDAIKRDAAAGRSAVVIGARFIGCEVAASRSASIGAGCTVVVSADVRA